MNIYCTGCETLIDARLTSGEEIYPHRPDLFSLPFWKCDACQNYVGCHHKTNNRTKPLGCIPTKELMNARKHIHSILDPLWKNKIIRRGTLYNKISEMVGWTYHTANIKNINEARKVYKAVLKIRSDHDCTE